MVSELAGGERIAITAGNRKVHIFERTMSTDRQRDLAAQAADHLDVWRLVTPMSAKQRARLDASAPIPPVDPNAPPGEQIDTIKAAVSSHIWREKANSRTADAKTVRAAADTAIEYYELGYGIPTIRTEKLWAILDRIALSGVLSIDAANLSALITRPRR